MEFDAAGDAGVPRLVFLLEEDKDLPKRLVDPDRRLVDGFRERLRSDAGLVVRTFASADAVELQVFHALSKLVPRPAHEIDAPRSLTNVPGSTASGVFVGRSGELAELAALLAGPGEPASDAGKPLIAVIHGLGGVGKSTLAARYANDRLDDLNPVWLITADSRDAVRGGLVELSARLRPVPDGVPADGKRLDELAEFAVQWLASHSQWLLVLDNVNDPEDVGWLLDQLRTGCVLITSRKRTGWRFLLGTSPLHLAVLTEEQAVELLGGAAEPDKPEFNGQWLADAAELVRELGCLPLAVTLAGAYLRQVRRPPSYYLSLWRSDPGAVLDWSAEGGSGSGSADAIARIWRITLDRLAREKPGSEAPLAIRLLRVLAWYGPESIPRDLFDHLGEADDSQTRRRVHEELGRLAAYSMITLTDDSVTVHRLVQLVARTPHAGDPYREPADIDAARATAVRLANTADPGDYTNAGNWPALRSLLPHIRALAEHADPRTDDETFANLLCRTGLFLLEQASRDDQQSMATARDCLDRSVRAYTKTLGPHHEQTLYARRHLAWRFGTEADLGQVAEDSLAEFGGEDKLTLLLWHDQAWAALHDGDLPKAELLFRRAVAGQQKLYPREVHNLHATQFGLGWALTLLGRFAEGEEVLRTCLADRRRAIGADHPHTLATQRAVAQVIAAQGRRDEATTLLREVLDAQRRVLPDDHSDIAFTRNLITELDPG